MQIKYPLAVENVVFQIKGGIFQRFNPVTRDVFDEKRENYYFSMYYILDSDQVADLAFRAYLPLLATPCQ